MLIKIPNSEYSLDFQHGISCSVYKNHEYSNDLSGQRIIYDMADFISSLIEDKTMLEKNIRDLQKENANLKKTTNDLKRKYKNSLTNGYSKNYENNYMNEFEDSFY